MINMTSITQPYVFPYSGLVPEDRGITGIVII
jgi:S-adenosylmethionine decarboxylase